MVNIVIFLVSFCAATTSQLYSHTPSAVFSATPPVYAYSYAETQQQNNHATFTLSTTPPGDPIAQIRSMHRNQRYDYKKTNYNNLATLEYALTQQRHTPCYQKRLKALDKIRNNSKRVKRTTVVNHDVSVFAQKYDISARNLMHTKFNHYQYQLHTEFLQQLTEATELKHLYKHAGDYTVFIDAIGHGIALGVEANHSKQTVAATYWADVVWQTIDIAKAVGEGIGLGVYNTAASGAQIIKGAGNAVLHPMETARTIARGIDAILSFFALDFEIPRQKVNLYQELDALNERITQVAHYCSQQLSLMSLHDKIKFTTAFATEIVAPAKIFKVAQSLCKRMRPIAAGLINSIREEQVAVEIANGERLVLNTIDNPAHSAVQFEKLKSTLQVEEFTSIIKTTKHGIKRLIERRFTPEDVLALVKKPTYIRIQTDGAKVFIKETSNNVYNYMVFNEATEEVITCLKKIDMKALEGLGNNYGWKL